jgi:hypothetical protein
MEIKTEKPGVKIYPIGEEPEYIFDLIYDFNY